MSVAQPDPQVGVEAGERLVEQHEARLGRQRAGERDALALAAGQLVGVAVAVAGEADDAEPVLALARARADRDMPRSPKVMLPATREVREQGVLLEHEPGAPVLGLDAPRAVVDDVAADADLALVGGGQPGDDAQQRRLAAPARADERDQLVVGDGRGRRRPPRRRRPKALRTPRRSRTGLGHGRAVGARRASGRGAGSAGRRGRGRRR